MGKKHTVQEMQTKTKEGRTRSCVSWLPSSTEEDERPSKCTRAMSSAGRYGRDIETRKSSTKAQKRKMTPGMWNARGIVAGAGSWGMRGAVAVV